MNPYDEETIAKKWTYILWSRGQLEELRLNGYIAGEPGLTDLGWQQYLEQRDRLLEWDFKPDLNDLAIVLLTNPRVTSFYAEILMKMILENWKNTVNQRSAVCPGS